jgi:intracellular sulfur oxidation DsrE/DsrF family protein
MLNALLDNELDPKDRAQLLEQMQADKNLAGEFCELRMVKDALQVALNTVPVPERHQGKTSRHSWLTMAAGLLMFALGALVSGLVLQPQESSQRVTLIDPLGYGQAPAQAENREMRIVFHLTNPDILIAEELLNEVELVLNEYQEQHHPLRVEVVANNEGLSLFRKGMSVHSERIAKMSKSYPNLTFVACLNTINRLKVENGIEVVLVPTVKLTESGVNHVAVRQQEGWAYIRL